MKCPYCGKEIKNEALACPYCWKDIPEIVRRNEMQNTQINIETVHQMPSDDLVETTSSKSLLTSKEKLMTWLAVLFVPCGILIVGGIYYSMRKKNPQKAAQLNRTSWYAFLVGVIIIVLSMIGPCVSESKNMDFDKYVQAVEKNLNPSTGTTMSIDKQNHRIIFSTPVDLSNDAPFDINEMKKNIIDEAKKTSNGQQEIEIIKEVNAILVYRYVTKDNANIDVTIYPSDW